MEEKELDKFAKKSGVNKRIARKYFAELEKAGVDWQHFDMDTIATEIQDFSQTGGRMEHQELRKRLGLPDIVEKKAEEEAFKQEIESLMFDKPGIKTLLRRIYENPKISKKQKEQIKEAVISGAPEITTLVALHNGKEQDYAKKFLREMIVSPTAQLNEFFKGDTLKIRSERGWIKEINDVPLKKAVRSIDFVERLKDFEVLASQPGNGTIAVYKRKGTEAEISLPKKVQKPSEAVSEPSGMKLKPVEEPVYEEGKSVDDFALPSSRLAMGGKPVENEFCFTCGRATPTDEYSDMVNGTKVFFCSEHCYSMRLHPPRVMPKTGIGQTVGWSEYSSEGEVRRKIRPRTWKSTGKTIEFKPTKKTTTQEVVDSHAEAVKKRAEELSTAYSYGELQQLGKDNNLCLSGSKIKMLSDLIRANVL